MCIDYYTVNISASQFFYKMNLAPKCLPVPGIPAQAADLRRGVFA